MITDHMQKGTDLGMPNQTTGVRRQAWHTIHTWQSIVVVMLRMARFVITAERAAMRVRE